MTLNAVGRSSVCPSWPVLPGTASAVHHPVQSKISNNSRN
jgi:hypothetical protein